MPAPDATRCFAWRRGLARSRSPMQAPAIQVSGPNRGYVRTLYRTLVPVIPVQTAILHGLGHVL